jgi:hypothetical protein|tara:strand:- start:2066 stop:3949 length:1884 start_codon:yes stop_codon:yes gene_type:complete
MRQKLELRDKIREAINVSVGEDKLNTSCGSGLPHVWIIGKEEENTTLTEQTQGVWHLFENSCSPWLYPYTSNTTNAVPYKSKTTTLAMGYTYPSVTNIQENHAYYDYLVQQAGPISPGDILFIGEDACWGTSPHQCIKYVGTTTGWPGNGLQFHGATFFAGPYQDCSSCNVDPTNYGCSDPNALNTDISPNFSSWIAQYNGTGGYPIIGVDCDGSWANGTSYGSSWQVNVPNMTPTGSGPQPWCVPSGVSFPSIACCSYNPGCIDNGMFSNSPTPGVPALNYDPNANGDCSSKPCSENEAWISDHGCCTYDAVVDKEGCDDPTALNYGICCDGDPNCTPTISNPKCCRYEGGDEDRGCMDPNALNYNKCCDTTDPNCVPNIDTKDCCKYDVEPSIHVWDLGTCCQPGQACGLWYPMLGSSLGISFVVTNPVYQQANNDLWLALGSPAVGDFNRIYAQGTCVEYIGLIPLNTYPIWNASSVNNTFLNSWPLDTNLYNDCKCEDGRGGTEDKGCMDPNALNNGECCNGDPNCTAIYPNPECCRYEDNPVDEIYCECCDKFGDNISMVQTVSSPADCIGAENTVYSGMGVYGCNVSPVSGGPGTKCKKPIPTNDFPVELSEEIKRIKELL